MLIKSYVSYNSDISHVSYNSDISQKVVKPSCLYLFLD